jgi:predicted metal-dependent hydrolase
MRITIRDGGEVVVTLPQGVQEARASAFVKSKERWITQARSKVLRQQSSTTIPKRSVSDFKQYKAAAHTFVTARLQECNTHYRYVWNNVSIKNTSSRWGSCSKKKNLSFSYRIIFLPPELQDYLIIHELCHLGEFNHSPQFWKLVEAELPNYKHLRKELRRVT